MKSRANERNAKFTLVFYCEHSRDSNTRSVVEGDSLIYRFSVLTFQISLLLMVVVAVAISVAITIAVTIPITVFTTVAVGAVEYH